jgi:pseudouridine-5'-phosphate glycosidase/pseudouridine kinase
MINGSSDLGRHSTTPGRVSVTLGGVARNIAEAAHRVMASAPQTMEPPLLISGIGSDSFARLLKAEMQSFGMRTDGLLESETGQGTAVCSMILDNEGELFGGVADMDVTEALTPEQVFASLFCNVG